MKEQKQLLEQIGNENPFRTPEGYFDSFTSDLMQKLPERSFKTDAAKSRQRRWLAPVAAVAAMMAAALFLVPALHAPQTANRDMAEADSHDEDMSDYMATSFFDEYTFYCYLTGEE